MLVLVKLGLFLLSLTLAEASLQEDWQSYKLKFNKHYSRSEDAFRFQMWKKKVAEFKEHNRRYDAGQTSYKKGQNKLTDLTEEERRNYFNLAMPAPPSAVRSSYSGKYTGLLPDQVDWRKKGFVTPVKDQGTCGSCWAFSTVGTLEGQQFNHSGKLVNLSESNINDCSKNGGNQGCDGGWPRAALQYVIDNGGIDTEDSYPYVADDQKCQFNPATVGDKISSYVNVTTGSEDDLQKAVAEVGPISVCIMVTPGFIDYESGVMYDPSCFEGPVILNHCITLVGYGTEDGKAYWLNKNSWGSSFGDGGYIKMARNRNNMCGIASMGTFPVS